MTNYLADKPSMSDNLISIDQLAVALSGRHDRDDAFEDSVEEYIEFAKLLGARQRYDEIGSTYNDLRPLLEVCESSAERLFLSALVAPDLSYRPHVQKDNTPSLLEATSRAPNWQGSARVTYTEDSSEKPKVTYSYNFYPQALIQPFLDEESQYRVDFAGALISIETKKKGGKYSRDRKSVETVEKVVVEFLSETTPDESEVESHSKLERAGFGVMSFSEAKVHENPNRIIGSAHGRLRNAAQRHTPNDF